MELNIRPVLNHTDNTMGTQKTFSNPFQTQYPVESSIYHLNQNTLNKHINRTSM